MSKPRTVGRPITSATNYTESDYDPNDGLIGGRWMRDTWGVVRWVQIEKTTKPGPKSGSRSAQCVNCETDIDPRALRCRPCARIDGQRRRREWARNARAEAAA